MNNLIRGEIYKIKRSKIIIKSIFLSILVSIFLISQYEREILRQAKNMYGIYSFYESFCYMIILGFAFGIIAIEMIVKEFKNYNITKTFTYGYKKSQVIISKYIVYLSVSFFIIFLYTTNLTTFVCVVYGFGEIDVAFLFRVVTIGIIYNLATVSIFGMVALVSKSNMATLIFSAVFPLIVWYIYISCIHIEMLRNVFYFFPFVAGSNAIEYYRSGYPYGTYVIGALISSISTFIITFMISIHKINKEDFK